MIFDVYIGESNAKMIIKGRKNIDREVRAFTKLHGLSEKEQLKLLEYARNIVKSIKP